MHGLKAFYFRSFLHYCRKYLLLIVPCWASLRLFSHPSQSLCSLSVLHLRSFVSIASLNTSTARKYVINIINGFFTQLKQYSSIFFVEWEDSIDVSIEVLHETTHWERTIVLMPTSCRVQCLFRPVIMFRLVATNLQRLLAGYIYIYPVGLLW